MAPTPPPSPERHHLLIVEDDADVRLFMVLALRAEGYEVSSAADAADGLRQLMRDHFDLILTDYGLPGKDGLWLLDEAERRGLLQDTKVMMLTAFPWLARDASVTVLPKPIDLDDLTLRLQRMLEGDAQTPPSSIPAHS
jgi:DNA-binding response OmpR family regulator